MCMKGQPLLCFLLRVNGARVKSPGNPWVGVNVFYCARMGSFI